MIKIFVSPSCSSCRKVKKWFDEQKIPYVEKNIFASTLDAKDLKEMLEKSENGTEDIIATKSKIIKENKVDLDSMTISQMIEFIRANPSVLKRPIMVDDRKMQVGYNSEEIEAFIPRAQRVAAMACATNECGEFDKCDSKIVIDGK